MSNRHLNVLDSQIKEAQSYITNFSDAVDKWETIAIFVELTKNEQPEDFLNRFEPHWEEVTSLVKVGAKKLPKLNLKDVEFHELNEKLLVLFNQGILNLFDVTRKIRYEETFDRESFIVMQKIYLLKCNGNLMSYPKQPHKTITSLFIEEFSLVFIHHLVLTYKPFLNHLPFV